LPRGRVEYSAKKGAFVVKTGDWLTPYLKALIIKRYGLTNKKVKFEQNAFWNSRS